ncbi:nicotinate-nucleotide--dimethylbenzimidazole phosphoribosyltransferase [Clostridium culturomicium]|uniref:nicotinate-nucleotide--dimethylbenzimidazole phosphoribosyltransferase n=1 Tax=Clostridium culturomicium TaxID=1499683 RepID=UPI00058C7CC1|nr:nicotinate-nucleotide--dimethylbenzimidazole phosphoribosyltransferase [Clostridium culturomicium]
MEDLKIMLNSIEGLDKDAMAAAKRYLDHLSKPIGSLGVLEDLVVKLSGIKGKTIKKINKKTIVVMCADNGIEREGVSSCPREVTAIVTQNIADGTTAVCKLSEYYNSDVELIDIGVDKDFDNPKIVNKKISYGTRNMTQGPAMTREEVVKAIKVGIETVRDLKERGYDLIGTGEMGVGNTTTSAAIISVFSGIDSDLIVGKGSGLTDDGLAHKRRMVKKAIEVNKPKVEDALDVLTKVGGLDIAGLCGVFLGGALFRIPVVIDGLISSAAALCAKGLCPKAGEYMLGSHLSAEPGAQFAMEALGVQPLFNLGMRLGEGTGCPIAFGIIEGAIYTMSNMASFSESGVDESDYIDIRETE